MREMKAPLDTLILKVIQKGKVAKTAKALVKNQKREFNLLDIKTQYKTLGIKTVWCWCKDRQIEWNTELMH